MSRCMGLGSPYLRRADNKRIAAAAFAGAAVPNKGRQSRQNPRINICRKALGRNTVIYMSKRKNILWAVAGIVCIAGAAFAALRGLGGADGQAGNPTETGQGGDLAYGDTQTDGLPVEDAAWEDMVKHSLPEDDLMQGDYGQIQDVKKTVSILGDSISTYEGWVPDGYVDFFPMNGEVDNVDDTWWKPFIDDAGLQFCANSSSSGSTCVGDSLSADDPKYACSSYRIDDLVGKGGIYPDIIIVYLGTNDLLTGVPLGENDGTEPVEEGLIETFSDAYSLILDKLESQYPGARIFCCTLAQIGDWGEKQPFVEFVNGLGLTAEDYSRRIELIAGNRGFDVIDLINCGITADNMQEYVTDGVHLNPEGMKLVRNAVEEAVMAAYPDEL